MMAAAGVEGVPPERVALHVVDADPMQLGTPGIPCVLKTRLPLTAVDELKVPPTLQETGDPTPPVLLNVGKVIVAGELVEAVMLVEQPTALAVPAKLNAVIEFPEIVKEMSFPCPVFPLQEPS
jgi:hypothetical protein